MLCAFIHLIFCFALGNVHSALEMTDELLSLVPNHNRAIGNRVYYIQDIAQRGLSQKRGEDGQVDSASKSQVFIPLIYTYRSHSNSRETTLGVFLNLSH